MGKKGGKDCKGRSQVTSASPRLPLMVVVMFGLVVIAVGIWSSHMLLGGVNWKNIPLW